jgi:hypothetical protein
MSHSNSHQQDIANPGAIGRSRNYPDRKKRTFIRVLRTEKQKDWATYRLKQKKTLKACKTAFNTYVSNMVNNETGNKKIFSYIKSRRCESNGVSPLMKDGIRRGESKTKAEIFNIKFSSIFNIHYGEHHKLP